MLRHLVSCLFPFLSLIFTSCGNDTQTHSMLGEFNRPATLGLESTPFQLARAPDVAHKITKTKISGGQYFFDSYTYAIEFDPMSASQFAKLSNIYGSWSRSKSVVRWQPGRRYHLTDFLPPIMQATVGLTFKQQDFSIKLPNPVFPELPSKITPAILISNCWGTIFELLSQAQSPRSSWQIFYAPHDSMKRWFLSALQTIRPFSKAPIDFAEVKTRNRGLIPGDVLMIGDTYIQHMAMYLDDDLFFEKAGVGPTALYRITHWEVLAQTWDPTFYGYRYLRLGQTPVPQPGETFGIEHDFSQEAMRQVPAELRAYLSAEVILSDTTQQPADVAYALSQAIEFETDTLSQQAKIPTWAFSELAMAEKIRAILAAAHR